MAYITQTYCDNADCNVQEVKTGIEITAKDYDRPPSVQYCPGCGSILRLKSPQ